MRRVLLGVLVGIAACAVALAIAGRWPFERAASTPEVSNTASETARESPSPPAGGDVASPVPAPPTSVSPPATSPSSGEALREEMRAALDVGTEEGLARAREAARRIVELVDPNDTPARAVLGHAEFRHEVPEIVSYRGDDFVRVVEEAQRRRWFPPEDRAAFDAALRAWRRLSEHAARLEADAAYRAFDGQRALIESDEDLRDYVWDAMDARPFVVFFTDGTRVDRAAQERMLPADRERALGEEAVRKRAWRRALAEKAAVLPQVHAEFLRRYAEAGDLRDLASEWGGQPDLPVSKRSFRDGFPIPVWVFATPVAYERFHTQVRQDSVPDAPYGYASPGNTWVWLSENPAADRDTLLQHHLRIVSNALLDAFTRQRGEWGRGDAPSLPISTGISDALSAVSLGRDRRLTWHGHARATLATLRSAPDPEVRVPLSRLIEATRFDFTALLVDTGTGRQIVPGTVRVQGAAFLSFLLDHAGPERRAASLRWLRAGLAPRRGGSREERREDFAQAFSLSSEADWKRLEDDFARWYPKAWLAVDPATLGPKAPALNDWPDYREAD